MEKLNARGARRWQEVAVLKQTLGSPFRSQLGWTQGAKVVARLQTSLTPPGIDFEAAKVWRVRMITPCEARLEPLKRLAIFLSSAGVFR